MKKAFLAIVALYLVFVQALVFAQYGGGGSYNPGSAGNGGLLLTKDNCPSGDYSISLYDGSCGSLAVNVNPNDVNELLVTGPEEEGGRVVNVPSNNNGGNTNGGNNGPSNTSENSNNEETIVRPSALPATGVK